MNFLKLNRKMGMVLGSVNVEEPAFDVLLSNKTPFAYEVR